MMKPMQDDQMIFMISLPRSGSTLLQKILGGHSDIYTRSEPWLLIHPLYALKREGIQTRYNARLAAAGLRDFISNIPEKGESLYYGRLRNFYLSLYSAYLESSGKSRFLDKTPRYYEVFDELQRVFPNAKFIVLYRNPLAILSSILETWVKDDYRRLKGYKSDLYTGIEFLQRDFSKYSNTHVVRYEELLSTPDIIAEGLFDFLELPRQLECVEYGDRSDERWMYGDPVTVYEKTRPDSSHISAWKQQLDHPQRRKLLSDYLQELGRVSFERLGYNFDDAAKSLADKAREQQEAQIEGAGISLKSLLREDGEILKQLAKEKAGLVEKVSSLALSLRVKDEQGQALQEQFELCDSRRVASERQVEKLERDLSGLGRDLQEQAGLLEIKDEGIRLVRESLQEQASLLEAKDNNILLMRESLREYAGLLDLKDRSMSELSSRAEEASAKANDAAAMLKKCRSELDVLKAQLENVLLENSNVSKEMIEKNNEVTSLVKYLSDRDAVLSEQDLLIQEHKIESGRLAEELFGFLSAAAEVCRYRVFTHPLKKLKAYKELLRVYQVVRGARKYN
jgi:succinate dehydrogenase flavin-adding protein (antitoxin of CptAB toxin-antitoxin module)